jgi:hypothetical protein
MGVYCKDCKCCVHFTDIGGPAIDSCKKNPIIITTYYGEYKSLIRCSAKNAINDCVDYEPRFFIRIKNMLKTI